MGRREKKLNRKQDHKIIQENDCPQGPVSKNKKKKTLRNSRKNQLECSENYLFDSKSPNQHTKQLNPSDNPQEQWEKTSHYSTNNKANESKKVIQNCFGFKRLEELCNKELSEIVFVMSNKNNGFMDLFKQNKGPDWIFLLMKVSAKICSTEFIQSKHMLLTELACHTFFEHLKQYILTTPTEKNGYRCENMNTFFDDCLVVFQWITTLFPKTAVEKLKEIIVSSNIALNGIKMYCDNNICISETIVNGMKELLQNLDDIKLTDEVKLKEKLVFSNTAQYWPPPQNFRELPVFPTAVDLEVEEPFLRPNILKGVYQDVEHYLDVQFRLLREDFIAPLREGIHYYKEMINNKQQNQRKKKINNIRIYRDVQFEKIGQFVQDKSGYVLIFDKNNKLKINWEMSKRFMYGSLLLFTMNEFNTFFLGVVLDRKIELLNQGRLIIELLNYSKPLHSTSFTMVESEVFFEPYKCSMEALKNINIHNFPMERYIISASNEIYYPNYIDKLPYQQYSIGNSNKFNILSYDEWPTKEQIKLDEMQYNAFKASLTNEFTIIQGPPGTGKTFIGLKIMKTLINNLYTTIKTTIGSKPFLTKPILVVCYTNHALDQFMEGILSFTNRVVRIGGRSKSQILEKFNLKNIIRNFKRSATTNVALKSVSESLKNIMEEINYLRKCCEIISYNNGVLELSLLKNGMPNKYHYFFNTTLDLLSWLFNDDNFFNEDPVKFLNSNNFELINKVYHSENFLEIKQDMEDDDIQEYYEADDPYLEYTKKKIVIYSITLNHINEACQKLLLNRIEIEKSYDLNEIPFNVYEKAKFDFETMEKIHDYFVDVLSLANVDINLPKDINLNKLNMRQRWALYYSWVKSTKNKFDPKIFKYEQKYTRVYKQYEELRQLENIEILNKMHIVAFTTTGAAKHRTMLEGLQSPIVIVEEAAEVLEAHIISSLTKHCQHLLLIGDHKQLRPSNAVYKLAKDYNFDISLFERMVNNGVPCYTLGEQHRMRPEIANLISPTIYPHLKNHISVINRENVCGVTKNLFFLNHNVYEKEIQEINSKTNEHEAIFLIMFARHLLLQGYKSEQVTILTTYSGQLFHLRSLRKKHSMLQGIKITVVDNYQGEESDIILLSLVRSNELGNVGFLKTENRVCVALSRAKYGLYIMGNMDNLYNSGDLWKQIKKSLIDQDSYGERLTLECAVHSGVFTKVSTSEDFIPIMEGGCTLLCNTLLLCGHYCSSICHSYDREHLEMKCREPCNKSCDYDHSCMKKCFMDCGVCVVTVQKELPCGHLLTLPCYMDPNTVPCEEEVETILKECGHKIINKCHEKHPNCTIKCFDRLDCGHACEQNCHKNNDPNHENYKCMKLCEKNNEKCSLNHKCQKLCYEDCSDCTVQIKKTLPCGHKTNKIPCALNVDQILCMSKCDRVLKCNHNCEVKCHEICPPCNVKIEKMIPDCGHTIKIKCHSIPKRKHCTQTCERLLVCGHKCKELCGKECTKLCKELVLQKESTLACGHNKVWVLCSDRDKEFKMDSQYLLDKCKEPCLQKLNCNDMCQGTCGQCKQGRLHVPCSEICNKINPCNHICQSFCKEQCPPCMQKCPYSCVHSQCTYICGEPCVPCNETCDWICPHFVCTKKCGEICDRKRCYEPCNLKLKCKHDCIGFCGEPCPPLCRICQKDEVTTIIFGNEDEPNARFVFLEDCGHSIESEALEQWMNQNDEEIILKQCPVCKTPILKTLRFSNIVKVILKDIAEIKIKMFLKPSKIDNNIITTLQSLDTEFKKTFLCDDNQFHHIKGLWDAFCNPLLLLLKKSKIRLPIKEIESLDFVINVLKSTLKYYQSVKDIDDGPMKKTVIDHFVWLLSVTFKYAKKLSNQQKCDINMEMARGGRIVSFYKILSSMQYKMKVKTVISVNQTLINVNEVKQLVHNIEALLMLCKVYNKSRDKEIQYCMELIEQKMDDIEFISDEERKMIHKAMSVNFHGGLRAQGHWCKCSNGHIYCVTECGRPMEKSYCPECNVPIGGSSYQYVSGTNFASEMDGARSLRY